MKILLAISGFPSSAPTINFARMLAEAAGASVTVINVIEDRGQIQASETILEEARQELANLEVHTVTAVGPAIGEILRHASEGAHDLVVLGAREQPTLSEQLLGSVARRIVAESPVSVLVVRGERSSLSKVLICTSGKEYSMPAIEAGLGFARASQAFAALLYVVMPAASMYTGLKQMDEQLSDLLRTDTPESRHLHQAAEAMEAAGIQGELKLRHGAIVDEILREARAEDYDLIVLGASLRRPLESLLLGEVTRQVLDRALRPVLVVRKRSGAMP